MFETITTGFAALGLATKAGIAGAVVIATTATAGATSVLPDTLQVSFDEVVRGVEQAEDARERGVDGSEIAEDAKDGGVVGAEVAEDASEGRSTDGRARADAAPDLPDAAEGVELPEQAVDAPLGSDAASDRPDTPAVQPEEQPFGDELPAPATDAPPADLPAVEDAATPAPAGGVANRP